MNVIYRVQLAPSSDEYALLQQASNMLEHVAGPSGQNVTVEWDRFEGPMRNVKYGLTLRDPTGEAEVEILPIELHSADLMRSALNRAWRHLLQRRSDAIHQRVVELIEQMEGD